MANSFSFNGIDMSAYGLRVRSHNLHDFTQETEAHQMADKAVGGSSIRPPKDIVLDVVIEAADYATLCTYMDSIRGIIGIKADAALKVNSITDRYWMARCSSLPESDNTARTWEGAINFTAFDPNAYDNSETTSGPHTVDEDPESFNIVAAGNAITKPVWTLTADDVCSVVTLTNSTSGEALEWTGSLAAADVLEIDVSTMIVKLNSVESMTGVMGSFPQLLPGTNAITVGGFSGTVTAVYRKRYL